MSDLEHETQVLMFNTRVLKVDPDKLDKPGYNCLRNFFETINLFEKKLKRMTSSYQSLVGALYIQNINLYSTFISTMYTCMYMYIVDRCCFSTAGGEPWTDWDRLHLESE